MMKDILAVAGEFVLKIPAAWMIIAGGALLGVKDSEWVRGLEPDKLALGIGLGLLAGAFGNLLYVAWRGPGYFGNDR